MRILFENARLVTETGIEPGGWVFVQERRIAQVGYGRAPRLQDVERVDAEGRVLSPGMIDLHAHGALGRDTMDADPEGLRAMARFYARHGVTAYYATTMSAPIDEILAALASVREVMNEAPDDSEVTEASLLGVHVEGPYIDPERAGAQSPGTIRRATLDEYERLVATGVVKLITLAPEYSENRTLLPRAVADGLVVAAGHSSASYDDMAQAARLGLSQATHLFNAMGGLHHREPGMVGASLALDGIRCQLIADNIHIHPAVLKLAVRAKGINGIILITDAMSGTGMPDGTYRLGDQDVVVAGGEARLESGALAGSTLTLERAVHNMMAAADLSLADALAMATLVPARAMGIADHKGSIQPAKDADIILLDDAGVVWLTMVAGRVVYRRETTESA